MSNANVNLNNGKILVSKNGSGYEVEVCEVTLYGRKLVIGEGFKRFVQGSSEMDLRYNGKNFSDCCDFVKSFFLAELRYHVEARNEGNYNESAGRISQGACEVISEGGDYGYEPPLELKSADFPNIFFNFDFLDGLKIKDELSSDSSVKPLSELQFMGLILIIHKRIMNAINSLRALEGEIKIEEIVKSDPSAPKIVRYPSDAVITLYGVMV